MDIKVVESTFRQFNNISAAMTISINDDFVQKCKFHLFLWLAFLAWSLVL